MKDNQKYALGFIGFGIFFLLIFVMMLQNPFDCDKIKDEIPRNSCHSFDNVPYLLPIGTICMFGLAIFSFVKLKDSNNKPKEKSVNQ